MELINYAARRPTDAGPPCQYPSGGLLKETEMEIMTTSCPECGIKFPLPKWLGELYRKSGETFTCPQGHRQHWPGITSDLKEEVSQLQISRDMYKSWAHSSEGTSSALRGVITKLKKQLAKGA